MRIDLKEMGKRIRKKRKEELKLTQEEFGKKLGVTRYVVSGWENGTTQKPPDAIQLNLLCDLFNCDIGYLIGEFECETAVEEFIQIETGLTEEAIKVLLYMQNKNQQHETDISRTNSLSELYSTFIEDTELSRFLLIGSVNGHRFDFSIKDMLIHEAEIFGNNPEYLNFYRFQLNQLLLRFIDRYFKNIEKKLKEG